MLHILNNCSSSNFANKMRNLRNVEVVESTHRVFDGRGIKAIVSTPGKDKILLAIQLKVPLIARQSADVSEWVLCNILEEGIKQGTCSQDLSEAFASLTEHPISLDFNYEQLVNSERVSQASLQYHIDQVWFEHTQSRMPDSISYFKAHDYDLLMVIALGVTISLIVGYILVVDLLSCCLR